MKKALLITLIYVFGSFAPAHAMMATYELIIDATWSETTHPGAFPTIDPHFSHLGGGTHNSSVSFWDVGQVATRGVEVMAAYGSVKCNHAGCVGDPRIYDEVNDAITAGTAKTTIISEVWTPAPSSRSIFFNIYDTHSLVTLATMIGPSPDWFVGVSGLNLRPGSDWLEVLTVDLFPYDGGIKDQNIFELGGPVTTPHDPIRLITTATDPLNPLAGTPALGTFTFRRVHAVPEPASMALFGVGLAGLARLRRKH